MAIVDRLFQIAISDDGAGTPEYSLLMEQHAASLRDVYPRAKYRLYEGPALRRFIVDRFGGEVADAYDRLAPYSFKADLGRYCLLYEFGGLYSDLSFQHLKAIDVSSDPAMVVFRDMRMRPPWSIANSIIYCRPGRDELAQIIRRITDHAKTGFYGNSTLDPTGPFLFGSVLAQSGDWPAIQFGKSQWVPPKRHLRDLVAGYRQKGWRGPEPERRIRINKIMPGGDVVATKNKARDASVADLIGPHGNNYGHLWHRRQIWGESTTKLKAGDALLTLGRLARVESGAIVFESGQPGERLRGPRWAIGPGTHLISLDFVPGSVTGEFDLSMESGDSGEIAVHRDNSVGQYTFLFDLPTAAEGVEFRLIGTASFAGVLRSVELLEATGDDE